MTIHFAPYYNGSSKSDWRFTTEAQRSRRRVFLPWPGDPLASPEGEADGGQATAREKILHLRRKLSSLAPTVDLNALGYQIVPVGLRFFARAGKKYSSLCARRVSVLSRRIYRALASTVCGVKAIGVIRNSRFANGNYLPMLCGGPKPVYTLRSFP
jgi:hypothetical protein